MADISLFGSKKERIADQVIRYLQDPNDADLQLSDADKRRIDRYQEIHQLRKNSYRKSEICKMIETKYGISKRQVQRDIGEVEYIFGKFERVNMEYERAFLLEQSRVNIRMATATKNTDKISKALIVHAKICGHDKENADMPDFAKLEQHIYNFNIPDQLMTTLLSIASKGAVQLDTIIPPKALQ